MIKIVNGNVCTIFNMQASCEAQTITNAEDVMQNKVEQHIRSATEQQKETQRQELQKKKQLTEGKKSIFLLGDEEYLEISEKYVDYIPLKIQLGQKHPGSIVESVSLSSTTPPDGWYTLALPEPMIKRGALSSLQLEAVVYSCQQHEQILPNGSRAGFCIGDGPGVGKGRIVAGIIYENYLKGRKKSIWISASSGLKCHAEEELKAIDASCIAVHGLNKMSYAKISADVNGYVKEGLVFSSYLTLSGESQSNERFGTRLKQLVNWCGNDFDGVVVFDDCNRKNLTPNCLSKSTKTEMAVNKLQEMLPKARIVYVSATRNPDPRKMAFMSRLGLWGQGTSFKGL